MTRRCGVDPDYLRRFQARVIQDAFNEGTAGYWRRRAETFEAARPRPGEFTGQANADDLAERDARLAAITQACHNRAALARMGWSP